MTDKKEETSLGLKTKIRLDLILAMIPITVGMIVMIVQQRQLNDKITSTWTVGNMAVWAKDFQWQNPQLKVPDPSEVKRMMEPSASLTAPYQTVQMP
jgi:hypothetical protein